MSEAVKVGCLPVGPPAVTVAVRVAVEAARGPGGGPGDGLDDGLGGRVGVLVDVEAHGHVELGGPVGLHALQAGPQGKSAHARESTAPASRAPPRRRPACRFARDY